jgi:hypothetical protein
MKTITQTTYNCQTPQQDDASQYYANDYRKEFTGLPLFKTESLDHLHHVTTFSSVFIITGTGELPLLQVPKSC